MMTAITEAAENRVKPAPEALPNGIPIAAVRDELDRILRSRVFVHSHRIRRFLEFVVEESISGRQPRLKEYLIGLEVFRREENFDPRVDSIVRVEARRLRAKLDEYYQTEGRHGEIRIEVRKGSYVPLFEYAQRETGPLATPPPERCPAVSIGRFTAPDVEAALLARRTETRLREILINQGFCRVVGAWDGLAADLRNGSTSPEFVIEGRIELGGQDGRLALEMLDLAGNTYTWSGSAPVGELENLARSLNRALVTACSSFENGRLRRHLGHDRGFESYMRGRFLGNLATPDAIRSSAQLFEQAVERDPAYAAAWAALSQSLLAASFLGDFQSGELRARVESAARTAIQLNDALPEGHAALGAALSFFRRDWKAGEVEFQRALRLEGHAPAIHLLYGIQLACRGMHGSAAVELEHALDLDPTSLFANFALGWFYCVSKRYSEAAEQHARLSRLAPGYPLAHLGLGWVYAALERFPDALEEFTNAAHLLKSPALVSGCLGYCAARSGERGEALRLLGELSNSQPGRYASPVAMAAIYSGLGESGRAFECLTKALDPQDCRLPLALLGPEFEALRPDPRFDRLSREMGLGAVEPEFKYHKGE